MSRFRSVVNGFSWLILWSFGVLFIAASIAELAVFHDRETARVLLAYAFVFLVLQQFQTIADELRQLRTNFVLTVHGKITSEDAPVLGATPEKSEDK